MGPHFDTFVQSSIAQGRYKNVSEIVRAGLRLLEPEENKAAQLKQAIQAGIDSGIAHNFDSAKHRKKL